MAAKQKVMPSKPGKKGGHSLLKGPKQSGVKRAKGVKLTSVKNQIRGLKRLLGKVYVQHLERKGSEVYTQGVAVSGSPGSELAS